METTDRAAVHYDLAVVIPQRLREWRKLRGRTLQEIAVGMNTTPQTAQRLETGNMTMSLYWLDKACSAYEIAPADLLSTELETLLALRNRARTTMAEARLLHAEGTNFLITLNAFVEGAG